jgi:hypothetical protein
MVRYETAQLGPCGFTSTLLNSRSNASVGAQQARFTDPWVHANTAMYVSITYVRPTDLKSKHRSWRSSGDAPGHV